MQWATPPPWPYRLRPFTSTGIGAMSQRYSERLKARRFHTPATVMETLPVMKLSVSSTRIIGGGCTL
jgi:hypothetical protein